MAEPRDAGPAAGGPARRGVLAALFATAVLPGCARLPTSGPVEAHSPVEGDDLGPRPLPRPPVPGSGPKAIVEGFLRAAAVGSADFGEARAYLVDEDVPWVPGTPVLLHRGSARVTVLRGPGAADEDTPPSAGATPSASPSTVPPPREGATADVVVGVDVIASLDADGRLGLLDGPEQQVRRFGLLVRGGEWRIAELEDGVVLSLGQFVTSDYRSTPVYFPDATGRWLVPDVRYVLQDRPSTQTQVVSAVLDGPSGWLAPALSTTDAQPRLTVSAVPVKAGVATVDLTVEALRLEERQRVVLQEQLVRSLARGASLVTGVELTVKGERLGGAPGDLPLPSVSGGDLPALAGRAVAGGTYVAVEAGTKARVVTVSAGQVQPVADLALTGGARPAMSYTAEPRTYALVVPGRQVRVLAVAEPGGPVADVVTAAELTPPSFDVAGWVWTSPRRPSARVVAGLLLAGGRVERVDVTAPWLRTGQVVALRLSREGARAALLLDAAARDGRRTSRLLLCAVERETSGRPVALGPPVRLCPDLVRGTDVAWLDDTRVVVLGNRASDERTVVVQPWVVDVGGDPSASGVDGTAPLGAIVTDAAGGAVTTVAQWARLAPEDGPSLAVGDGLGAVYVSTVRGDLFHYRQTGSWEGVRPAVVRPAFPG